MNTRPEYDPKDYLGPGNTRSGGQVNPKYTDTFVFDNDFMALLPDTPAQSMGDLDLLNYHNGTAGNIASDQPSAEDSLFVAKTVRGRCRVVCFSPKLNVTVAEMDVASLRKVVDAWTEEYKFLGGLPYIGYVQIFENKGAMNGCSNAHPHGQIWATEYIPEFPQRELANLKNYYLKNKRHMLEDYVKMEMEKKERIVCENDSFLCLVPFWAVWPFESMVIAKKRVPSLLQFDDKLKNDLADMYRQITCRYDNLFKCEFPYSMGLHQASTLDGIDKADEYAHFWMSFHPPLLRSATVRKFMVGFELLCEAQRDLTAEQAAERLAALPEVHYRVSMKP